jgi:anti-sigma factor ChrR (cupin superfamily)
MQQIAYLPFIVNHRQVYEVLLHSFNHAERFAVARGALVSTHTIVVLQEISICPDLEKLVQSHYIPIIYRMILT